MGQSRNEDILENMLGAQNPLGEPQSREEALLMQILEQGTGGSSHNYSTDEQVVGTWIDGSDVYEKTIYYAGGTTGLITIPHNITNMSKCINLFGTCYDIGYKEGSQRINPCDMPLPRLATDQNNIGIASVDKTNITISIGSIWGDRITDFYITLRYTKSSS